MPQEVIDASGGATISGYTYQGQAYVVEENITSEADLEATVREEIFHRGLPQLLGKGYTNELSRIFNDRGVEGLIDLANQLGDSQFSTRYQGVIARVQADPSDSDARYELVEEVIARAAENPLAAQGFVPALRRVFSRVKTFARKLGLDVGDVSNADIYLLARDAFKAGRDSTEAIDNGIKFRVGGTGSGLYTRANGVRQVTSQGRGTQELRSFRDRVTAGASSNGSILTQWLEGKRAGDHGRLREAIRDSDWWHGVQNKLAQVHSRVIQFDEDLVKLPQGFFGDTYRTVRDATTYVADRPLLQQILTNAGDALSQQQLFQPGSELVTYQNRARDFNGRTEVLDGKTMHQLEETLGDSLYTLKTKLDLTEKQAMDSVNTAAVVSHAKDRNRVMWYTNEAGNRLTGKDKTDWQALVERGRAGDSSAAAEIEALVDAKLTRDPEYTASSLTDAEVDQYQAALDADPEAKRLHEIAVGDLRRLRDATNVVDRGTGKYSQTLDNVVRFYEAFGTNWSDTYLPLQGNVENEEAGFGGLYNDVLDETFRAVEGRETIPDVLGATARKAQKAVEYRAGQDVARSIVTNIAAYNNSSEFRNGDKQDLFQGTLKEYDINSQAWKNLMETPDNNRIIYYNPNNEGSTEQTALVGVLSDKGRDALKGQRSELADRLNETLRKTGIPHVTSFIASLKTYRNLPFQPYDAIRTTLTFAYNLGADEDFAAIGDFAQKIMTSGYLPQIYQYSRLLQKKDFAGIEALVAEKGPNSVAAQINEMIQEGGRNDFGESIQVAPLSSGQNVPSKAKRALKNFDNEFGAINNTVDLMGRLAYYQVKVQRGQPKRAAAARALNLANFGARGTWSGPLGGLYEFFRATASGAVGQVNNFLNGENAGAMMVAGAGAGMVLYTLLNALSDEDDERNNLVAEMDGRRFIRDVSFRAGGEDRRFGIGFGPVAVAISAGMQTMRAAMGHQSLQNTADNLISAAKDNAAIVPLSGISVSENPLSFVLDSVFPSIAKPYYQVKTNLNGIGIPVYQGDADDPYSSRLGTKGSLAEALAVGAQDNSLFDVNADILQHYMRSYLGTVNTLSVSTHDAAISENGFNPVSAFGQYAAKQFEGPETFTQIGSSYYDKVDFALDTRTLIERLRRNGRDEQADLLENDERYQDALAVAEPADDDRKAIIGQYRDAIINFENSSRDRQDAYSRARQEQLRVFRRYLDEVDARNRFRVQ